MPSPRRQTLASGVKRERNGARSYKEGHTRPPGREGEEPEGRKERSDCQGLDSLVLPIHPWMEGKFTCPRPPSEEFVNRETGEHYEDLNQMLRRIDETRTWIPELKVWQVVNPPA